MKSKRAWLFRGLTLLVIIAIAALMFVVGRGHTVYIDNKSIDYNGQTYKGPYKAEVIVKGEQIAKLYDRERGMVTCMGQKFEMTLDITQEKGGNETSSSVTLQLPYDMDGIVINLPALLNGLPQEVYMTEFVSLATEEEPDAEEVVTDEFALPTEDTPVE